MVTLEEEHAQIQAENAKWHYKEYLYWGCKLCNHLSRTQPEAEDHAWSKHKQAGTGDKGQYHLHITYDPCYKEDYEKYGTGLIYSHGLGWRIKNNENIFASVWHFLTESEAQPQMNRMLAQRVINRMKELLPHIEELKKTRNFDGKFMLFAWNNVIREAEDELAKYGYVSAGTIDGHKGMMHKQIIEHLKIPLYITVREREDVLVNNP